MSHTEAHGGSQGSLYLGRQLQGLCSKEEDTWGLLRAPHSWLTPAHPALKSGPPPEQPILACSVVATPFRAAWLLATLRASDSAGGQTPFKLDRTLQWGAGASHWPLASSAGPCLLLPRGIQEPSPPHPAPCPLGSSQQQVVPSWSWLLVVAGSVVVALLAGSTSVPTAGPYKGSTGARAFVL